MGARHVRAPAPGRRREALGRPGRRPLGTMMGGCSGTGGAGQGLRGRDAAMRKAGGGKLPGEPVGNRDMGAAFSEAPDVAPARARRTPRSWRNELGPPRRSSSGGGGSQARAAAAAPTAGGRRRWRVLPWFYRDPQGAVQGPFEATQMRQWFQAGYFDDDLPLRQGRTATSIHLNCSSRTRRGRSSRSPRTSAPPPPKPPAPPPAAPACSAARPRRRRPAGAAAEPGPSFMWAAASSSLNRGAAAAARLRHGRPGIGGAHGAAGARARAPAPARAAWRRRRPRPRRRRRRRRRRPRRPSA